MGHQQASSIYATKQFEFMQLSAPVGYPIGSMRPVDAGVDSDNDGFGRMKS